MSLEVNQFAEALIKMLRRDMNNYADDLASNSCKTMEDYRHICGRLQGLAQAEDYIKDLAKKVENSNE